MREKFIPDQNHKQQPDQNIQRWNKLSCTQMLDKKTRICGMCINELAQQDESINYNAKIMHNQIYKCINIYNVNGFSKSTTNNNPHNLSNPNIYLKILTSILNKEHCSSWRNLSSSSDVKQPFFPLIAIFSSSSLALSSTSSMLTSTSTVDKVKSHP